VIKKEQPPYEFKILVILEEPKYEEESKNYRNHQDEIIAKMIDKIKSFDAVDVRSSFLKELNKEKPQGKNNDKIRFTYIIGDQKKALESYEYFT
jgi:hypothetical protein